MRNSDEVRLLYNVLTSKLDSHGVIWFAMNGSIQLGLIGRPRIVIIPGVIKFGFVEYSTHKDLSSYEFLDFEYGPLESPASDPETIIDELVSLAVILKRQTDNASNTRDTELLRLRQCDPSMVESAILNILKELGYKNASCIGYKGLCRIRISDGPWDKDYLIAGGVYSNSAGQIFGVLDMSDASPILTINDALQQLIEGQ